MTLLGVGSFLKIHNKITRGPKKPGKKNPSGRQTANEEKKNISWHIAYLVTSSTEVTTVSALFNLGWLS